MSDYQIEIQGQRYKPHQATSTHLLTGFGLLGVAAFTALLGSADWVKTVFSRSVIPHSWISAFLILYAIVVLYLIFFKRSWLVAPQRNRNFRFLHIAINTVFGIVFLLSKWWLAAAILGLLLVSNVVAFLVERKAQAPLLVSFNKDKIILPPIARRGELAWHEVAKVLLRHGTLTIDCLNNVLYQWTIKYNTTAQEDFERFCAEQIAAAEQYRSQDDW